MQFTTNYAMPSAYLKGYFGDRKAEAAKVAAVADAVAANTSDPVQKEKIQAAAQGARDSVDSNGLKVQR